MSRTKSALLIIPWIFFSLTVLHAQEKPKKDVRAEYKNIDFKWERVDWAIKYEVQVADNTGKLLIKKIVKDSAVQFSLPPGRYRIRIGVYDKFQKIAAWSDWQDTQILKAKPKVTAALNLGIKVSGGGTYFMFLSSWESPFDNSFMGASGKISLNLGEFILFRPSDSIKYTGFMRHIGLDIDGGYIQFKGKDIPGQIKVDLTGYYVGGGIYFTTAFNFPLNLIIRGGGGMIRSDFNYYVNSTTEPDLTITSEDPYIRAGASLEYSFLSYLYLEAGADYFLVRYIDFDLKSIRYFAQIGVKL